MECCSWGACPQQKSSCFIKEAQSYGGAKIAFLSSCQYTHGCYAPASWAARHTTVCLDTLVCMQKLRADSRLCHENVCTSNSMGSSEIWDKYHECCIGNGDKFHEAKPSEIYHFQYNKSGIYPKFHCYPCYSQLIPYSLHMLH